MISVEFMKRVAHLKPNTFMEMYYLLAQAGLDSQILVYGCNQKLQETLESLQGRKILIH